MSVQTVNFSGAKQAGKVSVPKAKALSAVGLATVLKATTANADRLRAKTKLRGEVRGGGRKPWRQKGTGRARAGSNRSPVWRGGGVTFGPSGEPRAIKRIPRKVRRSAVLTVLAAREEAGNILVVSGKPSLAKSKEAAKFYAKLGLTGSTLFVVTPKEVGDTGGLRNLRDLELTTTDDVNVADLARHANVAFSSEAFDVVIGTEKPAAAPAKPAVKPVAKKPATVKKTPAKKAPAKKSGGTK